MQDLSSNMDRIKLWQIIVCFAIVLLCSTSSVAQVEEDRCSSFCWNSVQPNSGVSGGTIQEGVTNEEDCKALCFNAEGCIGVEWDKNFNMCWLQMTSSLLYNKPNVNHWSVDNCTDECVPYCWSLVPPSGEFGSGGHYEPNIRDENFCKINCSNTLGCGAIVWTGNCFILNPAENFGVYNGGRHWVISRNLPTSCNGSTSPAASSVAPPQNTTVSLGVLLDERPTGRSDNLIAGIIVLAVFLGLCIVIIFGLVVNTIRIERQKSDLKSVGMDANYEVMQKTSTSERIEDRTYTDMVQVHIDEPVYEETTS